MHQHSIAREIRPARRAERRRRFYFSLRSPYSWLAYLDLRAARPDLSAELTWIPFWEPGPAMAQRLVAAGVDFPYVAMPRAKHLYILQDVRRLAEARGLRVRWPIDRSPVWDVPHLAYLGAARAGRGARFVELCYRARWEQGRDICDPATMADLGDRLGLDPAMLAGAADDTELCEAGVAALRSADRDGAFGVPFFIDGYDKYWGIDRLDAFLTRSGIDGPDRVPAGSGGAADRASDQGHAGGCG